MAKFCRSCGSPLEEGIEKCPNCGAPTQGPVAAAAPAQQESSIDWKGIWGSIVTTVKKGVAAVANALRKLDLVKIQDGYKKALPIIMIVVAILCLISFVLQTFGTYDVKMTLRLAGESMSESGPVNELYESDEFVGVMIVNILYGLCSLALGALALMPFFTFSANIPVVKKLFKGLSLMGLGAGAVYLILFGICGSGTITSLFASADYTLSPHFTAWINTILFAVLVLFDTVLPLLVKNAPAVEAPAVEAPAGEVIAE